MYWNEHERLRAKAATLYYMEGKSQREIAEKLQLSTSKVFRLIAEARSMGIVQINIIQPIMSCNSLETEFERRFNLREAIIINAQDDDNILQILGQAGADYLKRIVTPDDIIGISWGHTLFELVNQLQPFGIEGTKVVQLVGGLNNGAENLEAAELARRLSMVFNSSPVLLHCPAVVTNPEVKKGLLEDKNIKEILELGAKTTIALVGIGTISPDSILFKKGHLSSQWRAELIRRGAVGDVCMRFFMEDGSPCSSGLDDLIMGISLNSLKKVHSVICIAGGTHKAHAILGALKGNIPDVLVTDKATAEKIIELDEGGENENKRVI
ncbi:MAG: hypothetical protein PWQ97_1502 [Tepidanaerobacteraceae bacterium]|jgi:deoxyribonucleoside regulator|nr:deoR [Peptococcaceae bacterium]MDI3481847.1 hypothetical protein [Tepidanaerobacteraceae bacterium]